MKTQRNSILSGGSALLGLLRNLPGHLLLLAAGAVFLQSPRGLAAEPTSAPLPSIFVAPLHGDSRVGFLQPAVGDGLAEMLITELTRLGKFRVLESTTLESIKDEIKMGDDGWIAPGEKVEKGNWKGADYMLVGKITRFASKNKSFGTPGEVRAVAPQFLVVSLGANHGLKPDDQLDLYEVSEVRNKKGEVVMRDEKPAR